MICLGPSQVPLVHGTLVHGSPTLEPEFSPLTEGCECQIPSKFENMCFYFPNELNLYSWLPFHWEWHPCPSPKQCQGVVGCQSHCIPEGVFISSLGGAEDPEAVTGWGTGWHSEQLSCPKCQQHPFPWEAPSLEHVSLQWSKTSKQIWVHRGKRLT